MIRPFRFLTIAMAVAAFSGRSPAAPADADVPVMEKRPVHEGNAFLPFAGNRFTAWQISGRVDIPLGQWAPKPREVAPMPRSRGKGGPASPRE